MPILAQLQLIVRLASLYSRVHHVSIGAVGSWWGRFPGFLAAFGHNRSAPAGNEELSCVTLTEEWCLSCRVLRALSDLLHVRIWKSTSFEEMSEAKSLELDW